MPIERTEVQCRNRDLFGGQVGLAIISGAKRGKVDLFGTFKYHLSVIRGAVDKEIERVTAARKELRDAHGKRDGKNQLVTVQVDEKNPNSTQVVILDPIAHEQDESEILDARVTLSFPVPKLKLADILALDFGEQQGDYSGALLFIDTGDDDIAPKPAAKKRREA